MRISRYHHKPKSNAQSIRYKVNEWIRAPEVRLIDEAGAFLGVMAAAKARLLAEERGFDLVEVNPAADPPVVKLLNFGQFKYEKEKEMKRQKVAAKQIEIKGVRLSARIGQHDKELRETQALKFLEDGNKIKVEIILRGRERQHSDIAFKILREFTAGLGAKRAVKVESLPANQGGKIFTLIAPA